MPYGSYPPRPSRNEGFQNGGSMHLRDKKSPRAADMGGDFEIEGDVLNYVLDQVNRGASKVKLEISAWRRMGRNNNQFWSLKIQTPWSERGGQDRQYGNRSTGYQNQRDDYERGRGGYRDQDRQELQGDSRDYKGGEDRRSYGGGADHERGQNDYRGSDTRDFRRDEPDERRMVNQTNGQDSGRRNPYAEQRGETRRDNPYEGGRTDFRQRRDEGRTYDRDNLPNDKIPF